MCVGSRHLTFLFKNVRAKESFITLAPIQELNSYPPSIVPAQIQLDAMKEAYQKILDQHISQAKRTFPTQDIGDHKAVLTKVYYGGVHMILASLKEQVLPQVENRKI